MRLLHPKTLEIVSTRPVLPKSIISHVWSECFKWKASGKSHPKMFIDNEEDLGAYLAFVYQCSLKRDCNLNSDLIHKLGDDVERGLDLFYIWHKSPFRKYFDNNYLFSDAVSLYFKGHNIFPDIFGDQWRKYVPVESRKEIMRQLEKSKS